MVSLDETVRRLAEERVRELLAPVLVRLELADGGDAGERLLTIAAVAERTAASESTVRRWIAAGLLPTVQVPGRVAGKERVRVRLCDLDSWIRGLPASRRRPDSDEGSGRAVGGTATAGRPARVRGLAAGDGSLDDEIHKLRERRASGAGRRRSGRSGQRTA